MAATLVACGPRPVAETDDLPAPPSLEEQPPPKPQPDLLGIVGDIPPNASREQIDELLGRFMPAVSQIRSGDLSQVLAALGRVREQSHIVASLIAHYEKLRAADHGQRLITLELIGELQRTDALPFLHRTIWAPLPDQPPLEEELTPRDLEEMLRVKAVHGLAYLRTPDADKAVIEIMQRHESMAIRIAAIDSYMWNHRDSEDAAQQLYKILPADLHKFVQRPRFHRGMDPDRFKEQLQAWQKRWGSSVKQP